MNAVSGEQQQAAVLGGDLTATVFLSTIVSFLTVCGTGCIQGIMIRQSQRNAEAAKLRIIAAHAKREALNNQMSKDIHKGHEELLQYEYVR